LVIEAETVKKVKENNGFSLATKIETEKVKKVNKTLPILRS
jgi:hypothetical protein